ncbi:MAG: serine hydroxymethyltransferase [Candidatus Wildermuthbacteria bacterium]|nr:serine hydroxymethyltransferase [Candidatus Wildermuthbacteria bacterium]
MKSLKKTDPEIRTLIEAEETRRRFGLEMIPSENHTSPSVLEALGSTLTDKYSEGYPGKRYYGGNEFIDMIENLARARARKAFGVPFANVQPYSGSPANQAVYFAVLKPGDVVMGLDLSHGGHLTHGWKTNFSGTFYKSVPYHVTKKGVVDFAEARRLALKHKPKLMWVGFTAYSRQFPFREMAKIADEVGAYLAADISHIAGLVVAKAHPSPVPFAHIITTTTHKTLRGPRGAIIMVTPKGLKKDPDLPLKIDKAIIPGLQGGPHNHQTAAIAVALKEALKPSFAAYGKQVVKNAKALAKGLMQRGLSIVSHGTDNHMMLVDLSSYGAGSGIFLQDALDMAGITVNKNTVPGDPSSPFYPSGIRLGTPAITTRGMKEKEMGLIADWIARVAKEIRQYRLPADQKERVAYLKRFKKEIAKNLALKKVKGEVKKLCLRFKLPY